MAKLSKSKAASVAAAEASSFEPLEPGAYRVKLVDVDASRSGDAGPYWSWEFDVLDPPYANRKLWHVTSLSDAAEPIMKGTFLAFGADVDTDTDDLVGDVVVAVVTTRVIQKGTRKGEIGNQISRLKPVGGDDEAGEDDDDDDEPAPARSRARGRQKEDLLA